MPGGEEAPSSSSPPLAAARAAYWTATMLAAADDQTCGEFGATCTPTQAFQAARSRRVSRSARVWERRTPAGALPARPAQRIAQQLLRDFLAPVAGFAALRRAAAALRSWIPSVTIEPRRSPRRGAGRGTTSYLDVEVIRPAIPRSFCARNGPAVFLNATAVAIGRRVLATNIRAPVYRRHGSLPPGTRDGAQDERASQCARRCSALLPT